jgi:hypothetical protein
VLPLPLLINTILKPQSIESINLIPLHSDLVLIIRSAEEFKDLDEAIVRNFDAILLTTMQGIYRLHQELKESVYGDQGRAQVTACSRLCYSNALLSFKLYATGWLTLIKYWI